MTIQHWTDDKVDFRYFIGKQTVEVRLKHLDTVDKTGKPIPNYEVFARNPGSKDWLLISTITEPIELAKSTRHERIRALVRMFVDDLPKL